MIIKSCRRKEPSFDQLLRYIAAEGKGEGTPPLLRNFPAATVPGSLDAVIGAFAENARHLPVRRNGNALYQEILSFHPDDAAALTPEILRDLAGRYLERRAPGAMACAAVHHDRAHPHIHLVIAANLPGRPQKLRLSRREFAAAKRELQAYQQERYPELRHSLVAPRPAGSPPAREPLSAAAFPPATAPEHARSRRLRQQDQPAPSRKELLRSELLQALTRAASREDFARLLQAAGIAVYERGGCPYGVISGGRKYRFLTLGIAAALAAAETQWQRLSARLQAIQDDRLERTRRFVRGFGYAEELLATLEPEPADPRQRLLRQDRRQRRRQQREERRRDPGPGRAPERPS